MKMPRSRSKTRNQHTSTEAEASAQYSASVDERDTISCFFADQVMGLCPKNTRRLEVERRSLGSPAQSTSVKADRVVGPGV